MLIIMETITICIVFFLTGVCFLFRAPSNNTQVYLYTVHFCLFYFTRCRCHVFLCVGEVCKQHLGFWKGHVSHQSIRAVLFPSRLYTHSHCHRSGQTAGKHTQTHYLHTATFVTIFVIVTILTIIARPPQALVL